MPHRSAPRFASLEPAYRLRSIDILGAGRPATETPLPRCVAENRLPPHQCQGTQKFVIVPDERRIAAVFRHRDAAVASAFRTRVRAGRSIRKGRFPLVSVDRRGPESAAGTPVCPAWAQYGHDMATNETGTDSYRSARVTTVRTAASTDTAAPSDRRTAADFGAVGHRESAERRRRRAVAEAGRGHIVMRKPRCRMPRTPIASVHRADRASAPRRRPSDASERVDAARRRRQRGGSEMTNVRRNLPI